MIPRVSDILRGASPVIVARPCYHRATSHVSGRNVSCTARTVNAPPIRRLPWHSWLPAQHGAWCLLGVGAALGLIAAGGISPVGSLCTGVIILGFIATHLIASGTHRSIPGFVRWGTALLLVGATAGVAIATPAALIPLAIAGGAGWASATALLRGGPTAPQALVAGGLATGAAAAAVTAAGGAGAPVIVWVASLVGLFALGRLSAVGALFTRWNQLAPALLAAAVPIIIIAVLAWVRGNGWWAPLAFVPATIAGLWLSTAECRPSSRRCGLTELAGAIAFLLLAGIDVVP